MKQAGKESTNGREKCCFLQSGSEDAAAAAPLPPRKKSGCSQPLLHAMQNITVFWFS
jgi:hypothetical protein